MGRSSGRKRAAVLGFLGFEFAAPATVETAAGRDDAGAAWQRISQQQQRHGAAAASWTTTAGARPAGRDHYHDDDDIDRRAAEFIDRVHRGMLAAGGARRGDDADAAPWPPQSS